MLGRPRLETYTDTESIIQRTRAQVLLADVGDGGSGHASDARAEASNLLGVLRLVSTFLDPPQATTYLTSAAKDFRQAIALAPRARACEVQPRAHAAPAARPAGAKRCLRTKPTRGRRIRFGCKTAWVGLLIVILGLTFLSPLAALVALLGVVPSRRSSGHRRAHDGFAPCSA